MLYRKGDLDGAITELRKAVVSAPKIWVVHYHLGMALCTKGGDDEAITALREAIRLGGKDVPSDAVGQIGGLLRTKGASARMVTELKEAIGLNPGDAASHRLLGIALASQGDHASAVAVARQLTRLQPDDDGARYQLGEVLRLTGDLDGAIAEIREAIRLAPKRIEFRITLGEALRDQGRLGQAVAELREAVRLDPNISAFHHQLGYYLYLNGDLKAAIAELRAAVHLVPGAGIHHYHLGLALFDSGDLDHGLDEFRAAVHLDPNLAEAELDLGRGLKETGHSVGALAAFTRTRDLSAKKPQQFNDVFERAVHDCERLVDIEKRLPAIQEGKDRPKNVDEKIALATAYAIRRSYGRAALAYDEAFSESRDRADDLRARYRDSAALAAALAGSGRDNEVPPPDGAARAHWRAKALEWLEADLAQHAKVIATGPSWARLESLLRLRQWQISRDLAGLRDEAALAEMPQSEREACRKLWAEVASVLKVIKE